MGGFIEQGGTVANRQGKGMESGIAADLINRG